MKVCIGIWPYSTSDVCHIKYNPRIAPFHYEDSMYIPFLVVISAIYSSQKASVCYHKDYYLA